MLNGFAAADAERETADDDLDDSIDLITMEW